MDASYDKNRAIVVLPPIRGGQLEDSSLRAWLAKSGLTLDPEPRELLARLTEEIGLPFPEEGLAALRMWGQTGKRSAAWVAATDPVYLEPRLDRLYVHALRGETVPPTDLQPLFDHLQRTLGSDGCYGFARLGSHGYLRAPQPLGTATVSSHVADRREAGAFLPRGDDAAPFRNILGEIEMALHDHAVNLRRVQEGRQPVNSLWLWGGGIAPPRTTRALPPLFSDDPLLTGYWDSASAACDEWPGSVAQCCADASVQGFIAVAPECDPCPATLFKYLDELRDLLKAGRAGCLVLLFRDGLRAEIRRSQKLRFWRRDNELLN